MKVMKKVMKSTPAKWKPTSGNRNQTLARGKKNICKGEANLCKGEANPAKGKPLKNGAAQAGILKKKQLAKVGAAVPSRQNQKKTQKTIMMKIKQQRSCSSA